LPFLYTVAVAAAIAVPNEMEFSYLIFTEQWNFTMAERRNSNGRMAAEWWKPGIIHTHASVTMQCDSVLV